MSEKRLSVQLAAVVMLSTLAAAVHETGRFTWATYPLLLTAMVLVVVAAIVFGSSWVSAFVRRLLGPPAQASAPVDNSALVGTLQRLREQGQRILCDVPAGLVVRFAAEAAEAWYREVGTALVDHPDRWAHFQQAGHFRTGSCADLANSLQNQIRTLDEVIKEMGDVLPIPSVGHLSYLFGRLRAGV